MDLISNFFKRDVSKYFRDLPLPNSFGGLMNLSGEDFLKLVPLLSVLALFSYILFREINNLGKKKQVSWVNKSLMKNKPKIADIYTKEDISKIIDKEKKVAYCRCWKSQSFPFCDGSHTFHNTVTGDNVGPLVLRE
ncbi:unnamed protein product [Brachionus calyciflorus]|uniref:CDGSH iron-sulfur domain-containing protein 2 homologue n=1 Tax=Brachionus calyciflorus TaxID=104777 RepID=A0A813R294_9BILA|nr:unnamed protein product [Brachionus calyciflorus]